MDHKEVIKLLFKCGMKLEAKSETISTAAIYYHQFSRLHHNTINLYDQVLIASTAIYLAGKVMEDQLMIRDIINVFYLNVNKDKKETLDLNQDYWSLRDSIVQFELLLLRSLQFKVSTHKTPHRYLVNFLNSISEWMINDNQMKKLSITSWALLNDYHLDQRILDDQPHHIAIAVIELALQCLDIKIPYNDDALLSWNEALCESLTKDKINQIISQMISLFDQQLKRDTDMQLSLIHI